MTSTARALVGPSFIGLSIWCAAGQLTVASPNTAALRLAVPAPWWVFLLALVGAALVPAWRRRPLLAMPALLSTLPWWPLPMPPIALMWTGPLAWVPISVAALSVFGAGPLRAVGGMIRAGNHGRSMVLAGVATLLAVMVVAWAIDLRLPGGDEPHYLAITQSLIKDHDLRIENNHADPDYVATFGVLRPDRLRDGRDGQIYSIHAPGLAVLVLPGFATFGYHGAQAIVLLLAAVAGSLVWRIGWEVTRDASAAWFSWAAVVGSASFLIQAVTVYPEAPGALVLAAALLLLIALRERPSAVSARMLVIVSGLAAGLPWLHTRFAVIAGVIGLLVLWRLVSDTSRSLRTRSLRALAFLTLPFFSAVAWFAFFQAIYGTPDPTAPYGNEPGTRIAYVPGGLLALLFDEQFGLLAYSPVLVATVIGLWRTRTSGSRGETLSVVIPYLAAVATYWMWWAGRPAPPARFAAAILPALAPGLAMAWTGADRGTRKALLALLGISLAIVVLLLGVDDGALAWNDRNAEARWLDWLGTVVNLPRGWPSFFWKLAFLGDAPDFTSELAFARHVGLSLAIFAGGWGVVRFVSRRSDWSDDGWRRAIGWWLLASAMVVTQTGWWLNAVNGLDPARSQLALLSGGPAMWRVSAFALGRVSSPTDVGMMIRGEEPGRTDDPAPWLQLSLVPAGRYSLRVTTLRPTAGQLRVMINRRPEVHRSFDVSPALRQSFDLLLREGADRLVVEQDSTLSAVGGHVELEPRAWTASPQLALGPDRPFAAVPCGRAVSPSAAPADHPAATWRCGG